MKSRIAAEQVLSVTAEGQKRLKKWWKIRDGDFFLHERMPEKELMEGGFLPEINNRIAGHGEEILPLMDITMMIRFLRDHTNRRSLLANQVMDSVIEFPERIEYDDWKTYIDADSLCDNLWGKVKEVLENETT